MMVGNEWGFRVSFPILSFAGISSWCLQARRICDVVSVCAGERWGGGLRQKGDVGVAAGEFVGLYFSTSLPFHVFVLLVLLTLFWSLYILSYTALTCY